jgi:DNA polymerase-3 subunit epsilon
VELSEQPLAGAEFIVVDTETNGLGGDACELTEIGTVLVGGGELHDRWESLVRTNMPLGRGIQRFTGITQDQIDAAPDPEAVLPSLALLLQGRVMVAHSAAFDRRVLRQAFGRVGLEWPDPPVLCTAALARAVLPLQRARKLTLLADALGIEVDIAHRALADAETCARILCALFPRLCAHAATIGDAVALLRSRRRSRGAGASKQSGRQYAAGARELPQLDFEQLPQDPGVYIFRDGAGRPLYVGKSVSIRRRARAHFAPSTQRAAWTAHAEIVDYRATTSELGALILENRLIKELKPPGNVRLTSRVARAADEHHYICCRLDISFPILEVAQAPAAGHAVSIGPLRGRRWAAELVEQLDSIFGLRHCGRKLPRRDAPSAYGQMGRCLSPCLGDLDPNLYRRRLDEALRVFHGDARRLLLDRLDEQMRAAAGELNYERAAALHRRRRGLEAILGARPRLAAHERERDRARSPRGRRRRCRDAGPTARSPSVSSCPASRRGRETARGRAARGSACRGSAEQARDRLLADVAALRERDRALVQAGLLRDHGVVEVDPVARAAALDPQALGGRLGDRHGARRRSSAARTASSSSASNSRSTPTSVRIARTGPASSGGDVAVLPAPGSVAPERPRDGARRPAGRQRQQPALERALVQLDVVAEREAADHVEQLLERHPLGVEQQLGARVEDPQVAEHLALRRQERRVAAAPRHERLDVVRDLPLEELLRRRCR